MRRIVSTTRECPCTSTVWPPRMKRAPCSAIACLALLEVSAKLRPLCTDKFCCQKHAVKHVGMPGPVGGRAELRTLCARHANFRPARSAAEGLSESVRAPGLYNEARRAWTAGWEGLVCWHAYPYMEGCKAAPSLHRQGTSLACAGGWDQPPRGAADKRSELPSGAARQLMIRLNPCECSASI